MKNKIVKLSLTVCFAAVISITSYGQTSDKTWSIGPELGVNFAKFGQDADETDLNTGLVLGGFLTYSIRNTHAFTAKVLFSQKGARDETSAIDTKLHLNYIEVPVVVRVFFNREGNVRPNIFAGPSFGFLAGAKSQVEDGDYEDIEDYDDSFNSFDLGLGLGLGLNIRVGNEMYFIIDTRYTYGLSDVTKADSDVNNQAIAISAGLSFGLSN